MKTYFQLKLYNFWMSWSDRREDKTSDKRWQEILIYLKVEHFGRLERSVGPSKRKWLSVERRAQHRSSLMWGSYAHNLIFGWEQWLWRTRETTGYLYELEMRCLPTVNTTFSSFSTFHFSLSSLAPHSHPFAACSLPLSPFTPLFLCSPLIIRFNQEFVRL